MFVPPTYEVQSLLHFESTQPEILGSLNRGTIEVQNKTYLKTQVGLIKSARVLNPAIADPLVVKLPLIKDSSDPKADLLEKLVVTILEDTNLIKVALELPNPDEAVAIVSAIVQSYLAQNTDYSRSANRDLTQSLQQQLVKLGDEIKSKRESLRDLLKKGNVVVKPEDRLNAANPDGSAVQPAFKTVPETHVQQMMAEIDRNELELIEAMSMLDVKREAYKAKREESQRPSQENDGLLLARIKDEFRKDPDVMAFKNEFDETREHLEHLKRTVRRPDDAARRAAKDQFDKLQAEYDELWKSKYEEILERLTAAGPNGDAQRSWQSKS